MDDLDKLKLSKTQVVYACGNGWGGWTEEAPLKHPPMSKVFVRRLCFMAAKISPQINSTDLASNLDLVPTILSACSVEPDEKMAGLIFSIPRQSKENPSSSKISS